MSHHTYQVKKKQFGVSRIVETDIPEADQLQEGEVLFSIERFSFTSNNITYAAVGYQVRYWEFFPVDDEWGVIPVWAFAKVEASASEHIRVGDVYYGYFPMSSHFISKVGTIKPHGFSEGHEHRQTLSPIYNFYTLTGNDPSIPRGNTDIQLVFRPLLTTSFLLDHFLSDHQYFDAQQIILTSASSKTAIALATFLKHRKTQEGISVRILGLTSQKNEAFVKRLGIYDEVLTYDEISSVPMQASTIVDFAGNAHLLNQVGDHLGTQLRKLSQVGMVQWQEKPEELKIEGEFFFAPAYIQMKFKEWTMEHYSQLLHSAWNVFLEQSEDWFDLQHIRGKEDIHSFYPKMLNGLAQPKDAYILSF